MLDSIGKNKVFWLVLLAHLLALVVLILVTSTRSRKFYTNPVTSVDLVEPVELSAVPEEAARQEPPPPPPPEEPRSEAKPAPPKKITRKAPAIPLPPSDLKKRLEAKLAKVKTEAPQRTTAGRRAAPADKTPFSWYKSYISSKMHSLWKQPAKATVGKDEASAEVSFRVYRDGHIEAIKLKESSGSRVMDESVLQAVRMADPLDPPPTGFIKGRYENLDILFELSD